MDSAIPAIVTGVYLQTRIDLDLQMWVAARLTHNNSDISVTARTFAARYWEMRLA